MENFFYPQTYLAPNAAIMSWRGMKGGIEAAKMEHEVVMSPADFAYIDYMQGELTHLLFN